MHKRIIAIVVFIAFAGLFWVSSEFQLRFDAASDVVNAYVANHLLLGVAAFVLFAALSAILSPFSSLPTVPFAVEAWGTGITLLLLVSGWLLGSLGSYAIGHFGLHALFRRLVDFRKLDEYRSKLSEKSEFILVVLFRLSLPSELTGLVLGSLRYHFPKYIAATLISEIPFALVVVFAGDALLTRDGWLLSMWIGIGALITFSAILFFARMVKQPVRELPRKDLNA